MRRPVIVLCLALLSAPVAAAAAQSPAPSSGVATPSFSPLPVAPASPGTGTLPTSGIDPALPVAWSHLDAAGPAAREDHTLTVDPDGSAAWLFGGRDGGRAFDDLWRLDLATDTWQEMEPAGDRPPRRFGHTATWVPGVGLVVFAGQAGARFFDDLWAFDPVVGTWRELPASGARPEARYGTCAGLGPDGRLWVSHGFTAEGRFGDTRAWDPTTGRWQRETPAEGRTPVDRCLHDCVWSPDGRFLLFGGQTTGVASLGDLWQLDVVADRWTSLADPPVGPRRLYALAADGMGAWVVGGADARNELHDDVWWWDLTTGAWERVVLSQAPVPDARAGATLIVDASRGRLLLFGGEGRRGAMDDLWALQRSG